MTTSVHIVELPNAYGDTIWLAPCHIPVVSVQITFRHTAQIFHQEKSPGLGMLLTSLLDEGAGPYTGQELKRKLVDKKITLRISAEGDHVTVFFKTLAENAAEAFQLLKLMLTQPRFDDADITRIKQQLVARLSQSLHQPSVVATEVFKGKVFPKEHPYGASMQERIQNIPTITRDVLNKVTQSVFTQNRAQVVVAGKIDEKEITTLVEDLLGHLPKGQEITYSSPSSLQKVRETVHVSMPFPQTNIVFSFPALDRKDPDFYAFYFAHHVLAGGPQSRLWEAVREKRGLAYGISSNFFEGKLLEPFCLGLTATKTESVEEVIKIIREEMERFVTSGITQEELTFFKRLITGGYALKFSSTSDLVHVLSSYRLDSLPLDYVQKRNSYFEKLTVEDVNKVIQRVFLADAITFVTVGK